MLLRLLLLFLIYTNTLYAQENWKDKYDQVASFGRRGTQAVARIDTLYGVVDKEGNEIIPIKYDSVLLIPTYSNSYKTLVGKNNKYGIYNYKTKEVRLEYEWVETFYWDNTMTTDAIQVKKDGKYGLIKQGSGEIIVPPVYDHFKSRYGVFEESNFFDHYTSDALMIVSREGKFGYVNKKGEEVSAFIYEEIKPFACKGSYREREWLVAAAKKEGKWGYLNRSCQEICPFIYDWVHPKGLVVMKEGKYGFLPAQADSRAVLEHDSLLVLKEGFYAGQNDQQWKLINSKGKTIYPHPVDSFKILSYSWKDSLKLLIFQNNHSAIFHPESDQNLPVFYDKIIRQNEFYFIKNEGKWGIMEENQSFCHPMNSDSIWVSNCYGCFEYYHKGAYIQSEGKIGYWSFQTGKMLIEPHYDGIRFLKKHDRKENRLVLLKKKGHYGLGSLDSLLTERIPCAYDTLFKYARAYHSNKDGNFYEIMKEGKYGLWNLDTQKEFLPAVYDTFSIMHCSFDWGEKRLKSKRAGKFGIINAETGANIVSEEYDEIRYSTRVDFILLKKENKYDLYDNMNSKVIPCALDTLIFEYTKSEAIISKNGLWGFYDPYTQKEITPCIYERQPELYRKGMYKTVFKEQEGILSLENGFVEMSEFRNKK